MATRLFYDYTLGEEANEIVQSTDSNAISPTVRLNVSGTATRAEVLLGLERLRARVLSDTNYPPA